jgi:hypothetical protein
MNPTPAKPVNRPAPEPRNDEIAAARALLSEIDARVFPGKQGISEAGDESGCAGAVRRLLARSS